jgi:hypothetical protein
VNSTRCERGTGGADESSMAANTDEAERQMGRLQREASGYKSVQTKEATMGGYKSVQTKEATMGGCKSLQKRGCTQERKLPTTDGTARELRAVNKKRVEQSAHMSVSYCCRNYCRTSSSNL